MGKIEEELVADIGLFDLYSEGLTFSDPDLTHNIPKVRERIDQAIRAGAVLPKKEEERLQRIDNYVLSHLDGLPQDYNEDDPSQPPEKWWWHLRAIKEGRLQAKAV